MNSQYLLATQTFYDEGYSVAGKLETLDVLNVVLCVELCLRNIKCLGYFHSPSQGKCITNDRIFFTGDSFVKEQGWRYYRISGVNFSTEVKSNNNGPQYSGCWIRTDLLNAVFEKFSPTLTIEECVSSCKSKNAPFIHLASGNLCYCADGYNNIANKQPDAHCTQKCFGDSSQICGGGSSVRGPLYEISPKTEEPSVDFYIGLTKDTSSWVWNENEAAVYTAFNDSTSGTCAVMSSKYGFGWKSVECSSKSGFICEISV